MSFHLRSVKAKLFTGFFLVIIIVIFFGIFNVYNMRKIYDYYKEVSDRIKICTGISLDVVGSVYDLNDWNQRFMILSLLEKSNIQDYRQGLDKRYADIFVSIQNLENMSFSQTVLDKIVETKKCWAACMTIINECIPEGAGTNIDQLRLEAAYNNFSAVFVRLCGQVTVLHNALAYESEISELRLEELMYRSRVISFLVLFFSAGLCIFIEIRIFLQVIKPVTTMKNAVHDIISMHNEFGKTENDRDEYLVFSDIIRLTKRGLRDNLTGLPTRALFMESIQSKIHSVSPGVLAAVYFVDMDNLKKINDTFGHSYGDEALKFFGTKLAGLMQGRDCLLSRYGGDEFVIYVQGLEDIAAVKKLGGEMVDVLAGHIEIENRALFFSASIGCSVYPVNSTNINELVRMADTALYIAKQNGKYSYVLFDDH